MFDKNDFNAIDYINFDESFDINMNAKSKIIFGCNGIGKSSIYKYIKGKNQTYDFLDYEETKESFMKNKNVVTIGAKMQTITMLKNEIEQLNQSNRVEESLKKYGYTSQSKCKNICNYLAEIQKNKFVEKFEILEDIIEKAENILTEKLRQPFFDNYKQLRDVASIKDEMEYLKNTYMNDAYCALFESIDDHETTCPTCSTKGIQDLKQRIKDKKEFYEKSKKSVFSNFKFADEHDKEEKINAILELVKEISEQDITELIICDVSKENRNRIVENLKNIKEINIKIENLQKKLEEYYVNIKKEEKEIKLYFENKFGIKEIKFDDEEKNIKITFERNIETCSEGEIHLIILLFKLYEFKINDNAILVIDDPLTSYDLVHQYKTIYEIANTANEDKKVLIFTHNIEMINIVNSQTSSLFDYQYIEKYNDRLFLKNIDLNARDSILSIANLKRLDVDNYLQLLIAREQPEFDEYNKVFHYDSSYVVADGKYKGLTNEYLVNMIENFATQKIINDTFSQNTFNKIIYICAIRVWIEKKFYEVLNNNKSLSTFLKKIDGPYFSKKIDILLPKDKDSILKDYYPELSRVFLMSKKVMLNQNEHYQSQIIPFNYALNISLDDLIFEIKEIKSRFEEKK